MDRDVKRYFKQQQSGGRSSAARTLDGIMLRLVFAAACYLWFRYNIENKIAVILLTAVTTLLFLAAGQLWREISFDRFVQREQERLSDTVLRERLLLMPTDAFEELCKRVLEQMPDMEDAFLWCAQHAAPLTEDDILTAYRAAQAQKALRLTVCSLSPCSTAACALLNRLPIHADCIKPALLLHMARQAEGYSVSQDDIETHIHSSQSARKERRASMQAQPFAAGRSKKYLLCAAVLIAASFLTGYALYYRLLAGLCLLLSASSFVLNRPLPVQVAEQ